MGPGESRAKMSATSANEQPVETEAGRSQRKMNLAEAESNIANCDNQFKTAKLAKENWTNPQGVENDASTSCLQDNQGILNNGSLDLKTNTQFYKVKLSTQLNEPESEEKDDEDKKAGEKLKQGAKPNHQDQPQLQGELLRQVLIRETLAAAQKILLEEPDLMVGFMSDFTESAVNVYGKGRPPLHSRVGGGLH